MKKKRLDDHAISEVVGILLILIFAVVASAGLYSSILSDQGPMEETFVKVKAFIEVTNIVLEHQGGEAIPDNSLITIALPDEDVNGPISEFLNDINNDGKWNIGERLTKNFTYDLSRLHEYTVTEIMATDATSNSIKFMGPLEFKPVSDLGVKVTIDNLDPSVGDTVQITITVTSYGGDVDGSGGVIVKCLIPEGLEFIEYFSPSSHGSYNISSGLWTVGNVYVGTPAVLKINCNVLGIQIREFVQLAMILDGSGSINDNDWDIMKQGLSAAIKNDEVFPHDGSVELTIIQFGIYPNLCRVEIQPTIITTSNFQSIANTIDNLNQGNGGTPMAAGIYLTTDTIKNSDNFNPNHRQIINLVTDGKPTYWSNEGEYFGRGDGYNTDDIDLQTTEYARDYTINNLEMTEEKDEFDSLAVGPSNKIDIPWLNSSIVWPQPGYVAPPFNNGSGWVSHVTNWGEFSERVDMMFRVLFQGITNSVEYYSSTTIDPNSGNNYAFVTILPKD